MKSPLYASVFLLIASSFCLAGSLRGAEITSDASEPVGTLAAGATPVPPEAAPVPSSPTEITIPGPLRSFLRMAGMSQKILASEVLPLLAHNLNERGYVVGKSTEYLKLLRRYVQQARELVNLAGPEAVIRVSNCDEAQRLLVILGYQLRQACGPETSLQVSDSERAFLTIDSGFPLAELEESLRGGKPFVFPYSSARAPVLFTPSDWAIFTEGVKAGHSPGDPIKIDLLDILLRSPGLAHLYSALAGMDGETAIALRQILGLPRLMRIAKVLDFYGNQIRIRSGTVLVPGGTSAESAWKELVGADPRSPGEFVERLAAADYGWLAAYFDALSYVNPSRQAYFTEPRRLKRFYAALRGKDAFPGPARAVLPGAPEFWLLVSRVPLESDRPLAPGGLPLWKEIVAHNRDSKRNREWAARAEKWDDPEQLLEGLFGLSRDLKVGAPLQVYLTLSEIDRRRPSQERLTPETARLLANKFPRLGDQYLIFSEFPGLNNESIAGFVNTAGALDGIAVPTVRANAIGIFQSNLELWQILVRQGQISNAGLNESWKSIIRPFAKVRTSAELFDATRASFGELLSAVAGQPDLPQDEVIALLAGPNMVSPEAQHAKQELAKKMRSVMDAQRLVSLDTLFALGIGLDKMAQGKAAAETLLPLAAQLREFELPRPLFNRNLQEIQSGREFADVRHTTLQTRTDLERIIRSGSPKDWAEARGRLAPFLRDTLVGLNYTYYDPPGAQMLYNNTIFVRSHDYSEGLITGEQPWTAPRLINTPGTGAGSHLAGSLTGLPYALAEMEQNFIVPGNVQSLIWEDLVPSLLTSSVLPRFWGVTPPELHAVSLYQRSGEELFISAAGNEQLRGRVMDILSDRMLPEKSGRIEANLRDGHQQEALAQILPGESFYLASEFRRRFPGESSHWSPAGQELDSLVRDHPVEVSEERLSEDFGVPHPAMAHTYARELLQVKPFPAFMGYSSRLMAECWDSSNLYWARLADEMGYPPVMLNRLVPELTHRMVENLFATSLEDWPAVQRAMQETGEEFRQGKILPLPKDSSAPSH
jgi:hypothetical protein